MLAKRNSVEKQKDFVVCPKATISSKALITTLGAVASDALHLFESLPKKVFKVFVLTFAADDSRTSRN